MFCPNCGRNCAADANFCSNCGTKLQHDAKNNIEEAAGVPCPYCGSPNRNQERCEHCGMLLTEKVSEDKHGEESCEIPVGKYIGGVLHGGSVQLGKNALVQRTFGLFKVSETRIPYDQLTEVVYVRPGERNGCLIIRWEGNKNVPIPREGAYHIDKCATQFTAERDSMFFTLFHILKMLAPAEAKFSTILPNADITHLSCSIGAVELEKYYEKFTPHREKAVNALSEDEVIAKTDAKLLIDKVFDAHLESLYKENICAAFKDLNLIVQEKNRLLAEKERKEIKERLHHGYFDRQ